MTEPHVILQDDITRMYWADVRAKPDYDPAKDEEYSKKIPTSLDLYLCRNYIREYIPTMKHGTFLQLGAIKNHRYVYRWDSLWNDITRIKMFAASHDILQKDVNTLFWTDVRAKQDYDPEKDETYLETFPSIGYSRSHNLEICTTYIREYRLEIRHGDILQIGGPGYRNDHLAFWSSTKGAIAPDFESGTDHGTIPSDFRVGNGSDEFHPLYWTDISSFYYYDGMIWLSEDLISEIHTKLMKTAEGIYTCEVVIRKTPYKIKSKIPDPTKFKLESDTDIIEYEFHWSK
jgi:hypothetical protein